MFKIPEIMGIQETATFKIPVMSIQETATKIHYHPKVVYLLIWLTEKVKKERTNWSINGIGFDISYDLEEQWYPIFVIKNRWLASAFVEHLAKYKPWNRSSLPKSKDS